MGMLSSIELPHWLMIGGAGLIAMGSLGPAFSRNKEIAPNPNHHHRLHHAQRCRRCQGCLILLVTRTMDDPFVSRDRRPNASSAAVAKEPNDQMTVIRS